MNSFFGLGIMELALIAFIALIVLGPQRLPGTIREVMKYWKYFRNLSGELTSQFSEELKGLDDLNPQRILQDLANELDEEVEQTKKAAGVKKPATKKPATKKPATKKPATKKATAAKKSTTTKKTATVEKTATPETVETPAAAMATAAAASAAKTSDADAVESATESGAQEDADKIEEAAKSVQDGRSPAQNGDMPAVADVSDSPAETPAVDENTILPSANADVNAASEQAVSEPVDGDGQQTETVAAERGVGADAPANSDDGEAGRPDEAEAAPVVKKSIGSTEPTPVAVNGKGVRPEDE